MARTYAKRGRAGKRAGSPFVRFAPDLVTLEDRSVPAFIYVDPNFTLGSGGKPAQNFNAGGGGPLGSVALADLTFVAPGDAGGVTGTGKFATSDLTTAFNAARDNAGADTILLAPGTFTLDNSQGNSTANGGFNDNTYFFNTDPLSILGSGSAASVVRPLVSTYDPAAPDTASDPVFAVRQGATFVGTDFALDGAAARFGVGIGVSGGTDATLTRVAIRNIVGEDGSTNGGGTFGFGLSAGANAGGTVLVQGGEFSGNARAGISFFDSDGQVLASKFTGRGAGDLVDYGVQVLGASNVYVTGSTFTGYLGKASADGTQSAAILGAADTQGGPGASLLVVGNKITGNTVGVILGSVSSTGDASKAVVSFNDLSGNERALDATASLAGAGVATGVTAGIDGRNNFFGGTGPDRDASTGSNGDATVNPGGTGSAAPGNVQIDDFRATTVPTVAVSSTFGDTSTDLTGGGATAKAAIATVLVGPLTIYVDQQFAAGAGTSPNQDFNAVGAADGTSRGGPLGTTAKADLTFVPSLTPGVPVIPASGVIAGKIAVSDATTAFNLARDTAGPDTVFFAADKTPYALDNSQGGSLLASYFFAGDNGLSVFGSGLGATIIRPTASTFDPADPASNFDPVFAFQKGADLVASDFTLDGILGKIGGGIGVSGGTDAALTRVALRNFVSLDGAPGGASAGAGLFVNPNAGGAVTVTDSQFSGNGRIGVGFLNSSGQVLGSTFTGRGAGDLVDYGVQAFGNSNVYISGSRFSGYLGKASSDGTESVAVNGTQDVDPVTGAPVPGGANLLVVGNSITGNRIGLSVASSVSGGTDTSKADVRFNDLSGNGRSLDAATAGAGAITAPNNFFGDPAGPTAKASPVNPNAGNISFRAAGDTADVFRPVTAPVITVASLFGTNSQNVLATDLAAAAAQAALGYVTDPRIQSEVALAGPAPAAGSPVVVTISYAEPLAKNAAGVFTQDKSLIQVTALVGGTSTTLTPAQYTVSDPSADGKTVTVTVSAATLAALGTNGTISVTSLPSSGTANTGNLQLTESGRQTGGPNTTSVTFGTVTPPPAGTAPAVTLTALTIDGKAVTPTTFQTIGVGGSSAATFTVTPSAGATIATVAATSSNPVFTVSVSGPNTNPVVTVTGPAGQVGATTITLTATDSAGRVTTVPYTVQVGTPAGPTIAITTLTLDGQSVTPTPNQTIAQGGTSVATFTVTTAAGVTVASTTAASSNPGVATVAVTGPANNPTVTVTGVPGATGVATITLTTTDSLGRTERFAYSVQVGTPAAGGTAPVLTGLTDVTVPSGGSSAPQTITITGTGPFTVAGTSSNPGVATVEVTGTGNTRSVVVRANPALTTGGTATISLTVTDAQGRTSVETFTVTVAAARTRLFAAGAGPGSSPVVQVYGAGGVKQFGVTAFELSFTGGVVVATGDVNGDGYDDVVMGADGGGGPRVRIVDGKTGAELANFFAFEEGFRGGVTVAVAKLLDTGVSAGGYFREQIVIGAGNGGGPRVSVFDYNPATKALTRTANFFAYEDSFRGGVQVAAGDLTGDGLAEIVAGSGVGGGPRVRSFTAAGAPAGVDFFAFDQNARTGVSVAVGQLDGTGKGSIVAGSGANGNSAVRVFGPTGTQVSQFTAFGELPTSAPLAVRVGTAQFFPTGPESILAAPGDGGGPVLKVFPGTNPGAAPAFADFAFEFPFRGGLFVG
jgi:hypothetical protein